MAGPVCDGQAVFKPDPLRAGIHDLQKKPAAALIKLYLNARRFSGGSKRPAGMESIFQSVGEQDTQVAVRYQEKRRERALHMKGDARILGPPGKGGKVSWRSRVFCACWSWSSVRSLDE